MNGYDDKGLKEGYWEEYYSHDILYSKGCYNNGFKIGYWSYFNYYGELCEKEFVL